MKREWRPREANRYTALSDANDDNWNTHASQYVERDEKPRRMRENGNAIKSQAPKGKQTNRYLQYGILINNVATYRHTQPRVETTTKRNATHRLEANRFSEHQFATTRNAIEHSSFPDNRSGGTIYTVKYPIGDKIRRVISQTNSANRGIIPTKNDKEQMNLTRVKSGIKPAQESRPTRARV